MLHFRSLGSRRGLVERGPATWLAGLAEARLTVLTPCAQGAVDGHAGDAKGMRNFELGGVAEVSNLSHAVQAGGFVAGGMAVDDIEVAHVGCPSLGPSILQTRQLGVACGVWNGRTSAALKAAGVAGWESPFM